MVISPQNDKVLQHYLVIMSEICILASDTFSWVLVGLVFGCFLFFSGGGASGGVLLVFFPPSCNSVAKALNYMRKCSEFQNAKPFPLLIS